METLSAQVVAVAAGNEVAHIPSSAAEAAAEGGTSSEHVEEHPTIPAAAAAAAAAETDLPDDSIIKDLQSQLATKDAFILSLQNQISHHQSQEESHKREISSKAQQLALLNSSESEKDSLITSL